MKYLSCLAAILLFSNTLFAQKDELFGNQKTPAVVHSGFVFGVSGNFDVPAGDMAKRFGLSYKVGGSVFYKTKSNWMIGAKYDLILGGKINEDSLLINVRTQDDGYSFIDQTGIRKSIGVFERGYAIGLQAGKTLSLGKTKSDNGLLLMTGVGFMQHKIKLVDKDRTIPQIAGEYNKGYDRLTNGIYLEQFVGYSHFSASGFFNYNIGFNIMAGFTQGRRDWLYDVMRADDQARTDILFGIRGGWYLPVFKRKSEDTYFE